MSGQFAQSGNRDRRTSAGTDPRVWLLFLIVPGRWGRWWTSVLIFSTLFGVYSSTGVLFAESPPEGTSPSAALFFCLICAYILPMYHYITERTQVAMRALAPTLMVETSQLAAWETRITRKPRSWVVGVLSVSLVLGIAHNASLWWDVRPFAEHFLTPAAIAITLGTSLVWLFMTFVVIALIDNAQLFNRSTEHIKLDILNTRVLTPFASVAVSSTLVIIGAQALFPVMMLDAQMDTLAFLPGFLATGVLMMFIFFLPIWPIHRRLALSKRAAIDRLSAMIANTARPDIVGEEALEELNPLLAYRRELMAVSEWPFDFNVLTRLGLYLIIPPLTWVGAAFIEILLDDLL